MAAARLRQTALVLGNGTVLVAGGQGSSGNALSSTELYDWGLQSEAWGPAASMATARYSAMATLLGNGKVLVAGGSASRGTPLSSAELYDSVSNTWSPAGSMAATRTEGTAT